VLHTVKRIYAFSGLSKSAKTKLKSLCEYWKRSASHRAETAYLVSLALRKEKGKALAMIQELQERSACEEWVPLFAIDGLPKIQ